MSMQEQNARNDRLRQEMVAVGRGPCKRPDNASAGYLREHDGAEMPAAKQFLSVAVQPKKRACAVVDYHQDRTQLNYWGAKQLFVVIQLGQRY